MARTLVLTWVLLCALLPCAALAQLPADAPRSEPLPAPPLLPAPGASEDRPPDTDTDTASRRRWHLVGRVALETVGGSVGNLAGLIASFPVSLPFHASVVCVLSDDNGDCDPGPRARGYLVMMLTIAVGETLGVYGAGTLAGGRGQLLPTIGGAALGVGATALVFSAFKADNFVPGMVASGVVLPTLGAILGYELSGAFAGAGYVSEKSPSAGSGLALVPIMGRSAGGSIVGGLAGQF